jgi:putative ABC transport system permease protein
MLFKQVNFYLNKDLGFESKRIFFSEINFKENLPFETIKSRMLQHPEIEDISVSSTIPFLGNIEGFVSWEGGQEDEKVMISRNYVNDGFIPVYHLNMVYGRNFSKEYPSDKKCCIVNETAVKMFGWDDPVGKQIKLYENSYPVIGVVKDFHPFSLQQTIPTYVMLLNNDTLSGHQILTFRFASGKEQRARQLAAQELADITPNTPFAFHSFSEVFFLDGAIGFWQALKKIFLFFAIVTLVISSVGLFGLVLYTTKRRIKEIGIRKVLGSSMGMIYRQLTFEILGMLVFAVLIASPAAFYTYDALPGAYKETLSALEFLYSIGILLIIAIITISYHVLKVALSNPVEALRYE